jgi:hypothetical protein
MRVISGNASKSRIKLARWSAPGLTTPKSLLLGKLGAHHFENGFSKRRVCDLLPPLAHSGLASRRPIPWRSRWNFWSPEAIIGNRWVLQDPRRRLLQCGWPSPAAIHQAQPLIWRAPGQGPPAVRIAMLIL